MPCIAWRLLRAEIGVRGSVFDKDIPLSATFYNNETPNTVSLMRDSTPLYNAT